MFDVTALIQFFNIFSEIYTFHVKQSSMQYENKNIYLLLR